MPGPTVEFWEQKFQDGQTPWDRGAPSPQLARWISSGELAPCGILVPGCGSGYEVAQLAAAGFAVTGLDYAPAALERTRALLERLDAASRARATLVQADALVWLPDEPFDAVYEQTCLCALYPDVWVDYSLQLHRWLRPGGRLFALFAQLSRPEAAVGRIQGPPYHCEINGMRALFPDRSWEWPKPPYARVEHPLGMAELAVVLTRR